MKILSIDTSSRICSVSILEDDKVIIEKRKDDEKTHSQKLMPLIDEVLKEANLSLDKIDMIACCKGPGSFTGIRIGIATVKAFADTMNISTIGVTSLEGLAYNIKEETVCSLIDAKHENVYCGIYKLNKENEYEKILEKAITIDEAIEEIKGLKLEDITFIGDGVEAYQNRILENFENCKIVADELNESSSVSIAKAAYNKYKKGQIEQSKDLIPVYLKKSQAERALEEKNNECSN